MLNLVFSFASAYTAPIVLMSQNRQSDTDRRNAEIDHQVNLRASQNIELLHQKLDELHSQKLNELTEIIKEQQQLIHELKVTLVHPAKEHNAAKVAILPGLHLQTNSKFAKQAVSNKPLATDKQVGEHKKVVDKLM
ncbi:membrane protein-like protein [Calothrix brevissima NIES-22]|nr:membrane protein-like protein [Calothrix brevissima NIES-22]